MEVRKRILFVDDQAPVLALLQALFRHVNPKWESAFVDRGAKALQMAAEQPFDVVVSDMQMPEMNGAELLQQIMERYPRTARVILSGYADQQLSLRSLSAAHQYLAKPFTLALLQSTLSRLFALERFVPDASLQDVVARTHLLPSSPSLYARFQRELASPSATSDVLGGIAAQDPALTAKLLQLVNGAFFGSARPLSAAKEATQVLGCGLLKALAISNRAFWAVEPGQLPGFALEPLCQHSLATGLRASRILALERGDPNVIKTAFAAGVLHDVGKMVLAAGVPELYRQATRRAEVGHIPIWQAEREVIGATHAEVGAYLLGLWGLPEPIVEIVAWHHLPRQRVASGFGALTAVHVANCLENRPGSPEAHELDQEYLRALRVDQQRFGSWMQAGSGS